MTVRLYRCDSTTGGRTVIARDPAVLHLHDHVHCPVGGAPGCRPGIYDPGRKMVQQAFYWRGPDPGDVPTTPTTPFAYDEVAARADATPRVYLGQVHRHFGHFLLSTASRLWAMGRMPTDHKVIAFSGSDVSQETSLPFIAALLEAFGLDAGRIEAFAEPTIVPEILLPAPAMEEMNFVHHAFARACNAAGDRLVAGLAGDRTPRPEGTGPIYLSKSRLGSGVRAVVGEDALEERLRREGWAVVHPETLDIAQQVALWRLGRPIVGFLGSAMHTGVLTPAPRYVALSWSRDVQSSFPLCDAVNGATADYMRFEPGALVDDGPSDDYEEGRRGFSARLRIVDPEGCAEAVMRSLDTRLPDARRSLSRGRHSTQSSVHAEPQHRLDGMGPTCGRLNGRYQFSTGLDDDPWWAVDLGGPCLVSEVVVHNREDDASWRSRALRISVRDDGEDWEVVHERDRDSAPFGGLTAGPLRISFEPPLEAGHVRLSIPGPEFLHLDHVDVLGERMAAGEAPKGEGDGDAGRGHVDRSEGDGARGRRHDDATPRERAAVRA